MLMVYLESCRSSFDSRCSELARFVSLTLTATVCRPSRNMIRKVRAVELQRRMKKGSKWPMLCTCLEGGKQLEIVLKLRDKLLRDRFSLVIEYAASRFAKDLGLESSEVVAVDVSETLAEDARAMGDADYARLIERSAGTNIGSVLLAPGFIASLPSETECARLRPKLTQITAFDFVIQNLDRQADNPNLLRKADRVILIDHEEAFGHLDNKDQVPFSVQNLKLEAFFGHVFFHVVDLASDFNPMFDLLAGLQDAIIDGYCDGLPPEWLDIRTTRLKEYIRWTRDHATEICDYLRSHITP